MMSEVNVSELIRMYVRVMKTIAVFLQEVNGTDVFFRSDEQTIKDGPMA